MKIYFSFLVLMCLLFGLGSNLYAAKYYVETSGLDSSDGTSWANAFETIQRAVYIVSHYDEIYDRGDTYTLSTTISVNKSLKIYGGYTGIEFSTYRDLEKFETI